MIYDIDGHSHGDGTIGSSVKISEDRIWGRRSPIDYGTSENDPLEFPLIFGVDDSARRLDRFDMGAVAGWLKQPDYKRLIICQPDMELFSYKCRITELAPITVGMLPVAFEATVMCDGPYAYMFPQADVYQCTGNTDILYVNRSNVNRYYFPTLQIQTGGTASISITNASDGGRCFAMSGLPAQNITITIDGEAGTIVSSSGQNLYDCCDGKFDFVRLVRGGNRLNVSGACTLTIESEFPMDIGC